MKIHHCPVSILFVFFMLWSCNNMDVKNLNDPDFETAYSSPGKVESVTGNLINKWFLNVHGLFFGGCILVTADAGTCSFNPYLKFGIEPRLEYDNHPSRSTGILSESYYNTLYATLSDANDVLSLAEKYGNTLENVERIKAVAYFIQGLCLGYIGLIYDKGFVVTHETDLSRNLDPSPYKDLITAALTSLDQSIAISKSGSFVIPGEWLPGEPWSSAEFAQVASSFAARLLVYSARNQTDDDATNWTRVYNYARNGMQKDFAPLGDDDKWYSYYHYYSTFPAELRTDMYIIHLMDPKMPARFPGSGKFSDLPDNGKAASQDARLETDFQYLSSCPFRAERGYYHFSSYRYKRLDQYLKTLKEPMPEFRKAENDYLLAEAAVHTDKVQEAADVMNASARVTRGKLAPLSADKEKILEAIHYERMVELMVSGFGIQYFQMRKENLLQIGTFLHLPIPGSQLKVMQMDYYTFGGTTGIAGEDYSSGGW